MASWDVSFDVTELNLRVGRKWRVPLVSIATQRSLMHSTEHVEKTLKTAL